MKTKNRNINSNIINRPVVLYQNTLNFINIGQEIQTRHITLDKSGIAYIPILSLKNATAYWSNVSVTFDNATTSGFDIIVYCNTGVCPSIDVICLVLEFATI